MKTEEEYNAEVLQLMRDLYPTLKGEERERAERLFPELKESEEERVLKIIKETLKSYNGGVIFGSLNERDYAECLYWLKEQGEHKKFRDGIQVGDKVTRNKDGMLVNLSQLNRVAKKIEKKEELTEFEEIVEEIADTAILNAYGVKELANRLRSNAKKQLQEEFDKQLELAYKNADKVQYERGYRKAVEDARKWVAWYTGDREVSLSLFDTEMEQKLKELSQG